MYSSIKNYNTRVTLFKLLLHCGGGASRVGFGLRGKHKRITLGDERVNKFKT